MVIVALGGLNSCWPEKTKIMGRRKVLANAHPQLDSRLRVLKGGFGVDVWLLVFGCIRIQPRNQLRTLLELI